MIPNNDLAKFDDFCDEIRDLAFENSQKFTTDVNDLRLNQLRSTKTFQPQLSQIKAENTKSDEKSKKAKKGTRKSPRIPINFNEDCPLSKIGCVVQSSGVKRKKKPGKLFSKLALEKQTKSAKLDLTRTADFDFDEFKASFARLNNFPDCILAGGRHQNAVELGEKAESYSAFKNFGPAPKFGHF